MKTKIKTVHEEEYSDNSRIMGVLLNYSLTDDWKESFIYIFHNETYIFFNTIVDMVDYSFYGADSKVKRAYMKEDDFDKIFDSEYIKGKFLDELKWD